MIGTAEESPGVAACIAGDARTFVRATIVQNLDRILGRANHDHRLRTDRRGVVVADLRHLTVMPDIHPGVGEQVLHLELEQLLVDIEVAMDLGLAHQGRDGLPIAAVLADHVACLMLERSSLEELTRSGHISCSSPPIGGEKNDVRSVRCPAAKLPAGKMSEPFTGSSPQS
jgi:hypothetical protein